MKLSPWLRLRRWFAHRFQTRARLDPIGRLWIERPDWWTHGNTSGVHDADPAEARRRLDEWQDEQAARRPGLASDRPGG